MKPKFTSRISFKTALTTGLIILLLLTASSVISIRLQASLSKRMITQFVSNEKKSLEEESSILKQELISNMKINLDICSRIISSFLYNFNQDQAVELLASYLKMKGILALRVLDADQESFGAAWKASGIITGKDIPEEISLKEEFSISSDVLFEDEIIGTVRLYYTDVLVNQTIEKKEADTRQNISDFKTIATTNIKKSVSIQIAVAVVIIIALIITIAGCLKIFVTRPISKAVNMIKDIAQGEGDLTRRLDTRRADEIGELSGWFNLFVQKLQEMIKEVSINAATIDSSSDEFNKISGQMMIGIGELSDSSSAVAASADEMSSNMNSVAAAMEETTTNITLMAAASEEMTSTIEEIAQNTEKARTITDNAVTQTQNASAQMNELGGAALQIGKVVETITEISEQINLLALNATIEAARAGEAGKGFAVVANEIKELANQTAKALGDIKVRVQDIQTSTNGTVKDISGVHTIVTEINEIVSAIATAVEEQSVTTREITENISHASSGINEVNENVSQGSSASRKVAEDIAEITASTSQMAGAGAEVKTNAERLSALADQLAETMGKFKI